MDFIASYNTGSSDPCITYGVPGDDNSWNSVGYATAQGCCSTNTNWAKAGKKPVMTNVSRATKLTPFTTASAVGKNDSKNLEKGIPAELTALTKVWGFNAKNWVHGGVHADNVGCWQSAKGFTVKYNGEQWTQNQMLWTRQTGDNYDPAQDPYGVLCPAPDGIFTKALKSSQEDGCKGCDASTQILGDLEADSSCLDPYTQACGINNTLTTGYMTTPQWNGKVNNAGPVMHQYNTTTFPGTDAGKPAFPSGTNGYSNPKGRVGGCFATQQMYGPGKFTVLANLPPTAVSNPASPIIQKGFPKVDPTTGAYPSTSASSLPGGRGYVFAMWTFSYTEAYGVKEGVAGPTSMGYATTCPSGECGPTPGTKPVEQTAAGGKITNGPKTFANIPGLVQGDEADGWYAVHNHEIDIEIPANSAENAGADMMDKMGLNTANYNTWMTDNNSYDVGALALYQQAQADAPTGKFFCAVGPEDDHDTFHEYTFVWYVDPKASATSDGSYVAFYQDGVEVYKCKRFVPRRSGRVIIGLWPAWWGSNYYPMDFNQVYCKMARMEFLPQNNYSGLFPGGALVTNGTQMYDQFNPTTGLEIRCGFSKLSLAARRPVSLDGRTVSPILNSTSNGIPWWAILVAAIGAALLVGIITYFSTRKSLLNKKMPKGVGI